MKFCGMCQRWLSLLEFHASRSALDSKQTRCKKCQNAYNKAYGKTRTPEQRTRRLQTQRDTHRLRTYGVTPEEYHGLLERQGGTCAICGQPETLMQRGKILDLAVDHDHVTGKVRGLLCHLCNRGIGCFSDDAERLRAAAAYL